jgi:DNA-binding CsgD family transcriptional regulator
MSKIDNFVNKLECQHSTFDPIKKIQTSQNFDSFDQKSVKEINFKSLSFLPNQFAYKIDCQSAEIEETKGNSQKLFACPALKSIDAVYEMIKPNQVDGFVEEIKTNLKFVLSEPLRAIPKRNMFSSIFQMRVKNTFKLFLRQTFILRSDKNGVITHTAGTYTALPSIPKINNNIYSIYGADALYYRNEHLKHFDKLLSIRELEILKFISEGYKNEQIAEVLFISRFTIETHRKNMLRKLEANSTPHLVALCKDIGLI